MSNDVAIKVESISKAYKLYEKPVDRLKEALHPFGKKYHRDFFALQNVSFEIKRGETVGVIGKNGSGKSTLLKIITGIVTPSAGRIEVHGKIAALLELGAGFNTEFTGIENIYMSGTVMGFSRAEMEARLDDIMAFADIGDFIRQPVKTYSSGMFARLAFAVNANVNPDILIVDEALAVGDMFFQAKCVDRMKRMMDDGVTILFVSHDSGVVKGLCQRGILLNQGSVALDSSADAAVEEYFRIRVQGEQAVLAPTQQSDALVATVSGAHKHIFFGDNCAFCERAQYQRIQNGKAEFYNVQLLNLAGEAISQVAYGQKVILRMEVVARSTIRELGFGYHIRSSTGVDLVYSDSVLENKMLYDVKNGEQYVIDWQFDMCLQAGTYNILCGMSIPINLADSRVDFCDLVPCALQFSVLPEMEKRLYCFVHWDNAVEIIKFKNAELL